VLRHEVAVLRRANPQPRLDWADRAVFAAFVQRLPQMLRGHRSGVDHAGVRLLPCGLRGHAPADLRVLRAGNAQPLRVPAGHHPNPDGRWTTQQIRNLVMDLGDRVTPFRFLVRDWAGQVTASFDALLADTGIPVVWIPPRCPRANCFAERFVRTLRAELTDRILIFSQRHLRVVLTAYVRHDNGRRPHRARDLRPSRPIHPAADLNAERITRRPVLGGLINEYERTARSRCSA
jgi:integrase-like protein